VLKRRMLLYYATFEMNLPSLGNLYLAAVLYGERGEQEARLCSASM